MAEGIFKSTIMVVVINLLSKLLGFVREVLIAAKFGSGMETDAFFIALSGTSLIASFITSSISNTFIPILGEIEAKEGEEGRIKHTNNMINIVFLLSLILCLLGVIFSPYIVKLLASGFKGEQYDLTVKLTRIGFGRIVVSGLVGILTAFLRSKHRHKSASLIGIPFNLIYIFYLMFLSNKFGIKGLMIAAIIASISQFLILIPESKSIGFKYTKIFDIKDKYFNKLVLLSLPVIVSVAINDVNTIIDKRLASKLVVGSVSALNYGDKLKGLILGVFIAGITTVIFPVLTEEVSKNNMPGVKKGIKLGVNIIQLITIPAAIGMMVLAKPIVEIAFQRGSFNSNDTIMTSGALIGYSVGLLGMSLQLFVTQVYYSLQDTRTPMIMGLVTVLLNIVLNIILVKPLAHVGLALATSISITLSTVVMIYFLKSKIGNIGVRSFIECFLKSGIAAIVMGLVSRVSYSKIYTLLGMGRVKNLLALLVAVVIGVLVYGSLCYLLKIEEFILGIEKIKEHKSK